MPTISCLRLDLPTEIFLSSLYTKRIKFFEQFLFFCTQRLFLGLTLCLLRLPVTHAPFETRLIGQVLTHQQLDRHAMHIRLTWPCDKAALFVALYEGGLLQARVAGSSEPLKQAVATLLHLTRQHRTESPPA